MSVSIQKVENERAEYIVERHRTQHLANKLLDTTPEICVERACLVTDSHKETESEPVAIRRAKALRKILNDMTIYIQDEELIVGNHASLPGGIPVFPEYSWKWILDELDEFDKRELRIRISQKNKDVLRQILPYWKGKTVGEYVGAKMSKDLDRAIQCSAVAGTLSNSGLGAFVPNYEELLGKGLSGIANEAKEVLDKLKPANTPDQMEKAEFLEAMIVSCDAVGQFAGRYATLAREQARTTSEAKRKSELQKIAEVCEQVPSKPARSFYEALQSLFFIFLVIQIESNGRSISLGRFDQYLYPFYISDLNSHLITRDEARP